MILIKLKYTGAVPGVAKAEMRKITKAAYEGMGVRWWRQFRPKHFTHEGAREYGYAPRSGESGSGKRFKSSYTARKLRTKGHTRPLVWSGQSEALARIRDVRATSKGVKVVIHARALNWRNPHSKINMRDEMTRVSPLERKTLIHLGDAVMDHKIKAIRTVKTVHIR